MVNLHFSLLPRWRGAAPVERAILAGDDVTGVDLMAVEEGLDTGGIYRRAEVADRSGRHARRAARAGSSAEGTRLLVDALRERARRRRPRRWASRPTPTSSTAEDRHLDWIGPRVDVHRRVRLGDAWTTHQGKRLKVWRTHVPADAATAPRCRPATAPVELVEVQPEGKARMAATAWANGARWRPGDRPRHVTVTARAARARRPRPHRARRRLRQPAPARAARAQSASRPRDRHFATELVYGTTRMRRACDFLVDRFLARELDLRVRNALRLGAYQLHFLRCRRTPRWARRSRSRPKPARGLVNAVLRRVADAAGRRGPTTRPACSYPDWIVERLVADLGRDDAIAALEAMNTRAAGHRARRRLRAGPRLAVGRRGGRGAAGRAGRRPLRRARAARRRALAATGADGGRRRHPQGPGRPHPRRTPRTLPVLAADAARPPFAPGIVRPGPARRPVLGPRHAAPPPGRPLADRRRRRPSAWRRCSARSSTRPSPLLRPGGTLVYSVCTLTDAETHRRRRPPRGDIAAARAARRRPWPLGAARPRRRLLPQAADTDGMYLLRLRAAA